MFTAEPPPTSREALAAIFWEHLGFSRYHRGFGPTMRMSWVPPMKLIPPPAEYDDLHALIPSHEIRFTVEVFTYGNEEWVAVGSNGMLVVAPFLYPEEGEPWPTRPEECRRV